MRELYDPFVRNGSPILFMDNVSAEMTKYAANAFLSVKISFINDVREGFTSDSRINPAFFHPGVGFGGSCFPKDVKALVQTGQAVGVPLQVVESADQVNDRQKTIAVWELAFKPRTDDVREAPAQGFTTFALDDKRLQTAHTKHDFRFFNLRLFSREFA